MLSEAEITSEKAISIFNKATGLKK